MGIYLGQGKRQIGLVERNYLRSRAVGWDLVGFMEAWAWSLNRNELLATNEEDSLLTRINENVVHPALNSSVIEMWNLVAETTNKVSHKLGGEHILPLKHELHTEPVKFLSTGWLVQSVSSGLAMLLPYTIAGKLTGSALKGAGARLGVSDNLARLLENEALSSITGAAIYDGLRETKPGETHIGNALGGAAAFGTFAIGGELSKNMSMRNMLMVRTLAGAVGGVTQHAILGWSTSRVPSLEEFAKASVNGMVMSLVLPESQKALHTLAKRGNETLRHAVPTEYFNKGSAAKKSVSVAPEHKFVDPPEPKFMDSPDHKFVEPPNYKTIDLPEYKTKVEAPENVDFFVKNEPMADVKTDAKADVKPEVKQDRGKDDRKRDEKKAVELRWEPGVERRETVYDINQRMDRPAFEFSSNSASLSPREMPGTEPFSHNNFVPNST